MAVGQCALYLAGYSCHLTVLKFRSECAYRGRVLASPVHLPAFPEEETSQEEQEEPRDGHTARLLVCTGSASLHVLED